MTWLITSTVWYIYLFVIGLLFFPLTARLFSAFVDKGYPFAKTIGIIVGSYLLLILGMLHIVPFTQESILFVLILLGVFFYKTLKKQIIEIRSLSVDKKLLLFTEELLFYIAFIALVFVRGQEPSVHGLEKFMDYGFIQSILKSKYFPPLDMWLSGDSLQPGGYPINYYYFGHLTGAFLIKLTGIIPSIGYNFILATIFAQGVTLAFSFSSSVVYIFQKYIHKTIIVPWKIIAFGALGSFLVNFAGNLHTIYIFTTGYPNEKPIPFWGIFQNIEMIQRTMVSSQKDFLDAMIQNSRYWYPNATRFIPFTIHEFPSYSYVVADLHGHVFDIPFVLLTLALIMLFFLHAKGHFAPPSSWTLIRSWIEKKLPKRHHSLIAPILKTLHVTTYELLTAIGIGFMIAIHYMTNAFDGPIYFLFIVGLYFYLFRLSIKFIYLSAITGFSYIFFSFPFSYYFTPFVSGIGVNCSPEFLVKMSKIGPFMFEKGNCQVTEPWMMFVLWGFFWTSALLLGVYFYRLYKNKKMPSSLDQFIMLVFAFGTFLIIIPEFFYIKDIYPAHFRANTMFKMGYQAFIMMSLASSYVLYRLGSLPRISKYITRGIYTILFALVFIYPFLAFPSYYPGLYSAETYKRPPTIDGAQWLQYQYPYYKELINYINSNIQGQPVILEAQGDSYTDFNLVSAYTGNPTIAGWWVHEWLWRGSADVVGKRIPDITEIYESSDIKYTKYLLNKYGVQYVVVTKMEKDKYPKLNEEKFSKIGTKVFESSDGLGALYRTY